MKQVTQSQSCDKHLKDRNEKCLTFSRWLFRQFCLKHLQKQLLKEEDKTNLNDWENWEILRTRLWIVGENMFVSLVAKSKLSFSRNIFFATVELDFEPIFGERALLYLSLNCIDVQRLCWGHRVVLFYILYFCYKKRRKAIINKLHLNIFCFLSQVSCVMLAKVW